jgi:hypothetical protein
VPESTIAVGEFGALLTIEIVPVALPAVVGVNSTVKFVLWPTPRVKGVARPAMLKPVPDADA